MKVSEATPLDFIYLLNTENRVYLYSPIYLNNLFDYDSPRPFRGEPVGESSIRKELRDLATNKARVVFVSKEKSLVPLFEYRLGIEMEHLEQPVFRDKNTKVIYGVFIPRLSTYRDPLLSKDVDFYWEIRPIYYRFEIE